MITMLLGGLWHGASWTFVVWGGLHGTGSGQVRAGTVAVSSVAAGDRDGPRTVDVHPPTGRRTGGRGATAWAATFNFVCLGWIFFRATSFANAVDVLRQIFSTGSHVPLMRHWSS